MAKNLTSNTFASKSKRYGAEPINLLEIYFGGITGTKYYSDREITVGVNVYEAVVKDWGDIDFILNKSATTQDLHISLLNTQESPISNIFAVDTPESKVAILYQWYVGDEESDREILFNGRVTSPVKYTLDTVELDIVNRILDLEKKVGTVVTKEAYPRSLPSHRGKIIPKVIGTVQDVPAVCIYTAGKSALRESLNDVSSTIEVDDGSVFPTTATWVLVVEDEQILMEANSNGGNTLTATTRGYNGTTQVLHTLGTQIYEKLSQFRYQVHDDAGSVQAADISNVRVNGVLLSTSQYTINQSLYPGQIVFSTYPQIDQEKETDFDDYRFDVVVNDGTQPYAETPETLIDDNSSNYAWLKSGQKVILQRTGGLNNTNQFKRAYLTVKYFTDKEEWTGNIQAKAYWDGHYLGSLPEPSFDPVIEEVEVIHENNPPEIESVSVISGGSTPFIVGESSMSSQGTESAIATESYSEEISPSSLTIDTKEFNPDAYEWQAVSTPDNKVPPAYFSAQADGLIGRVILFQHPVVGANAGTWESDAFNFKWIDWVYSGFSFSPPSGGGTARIISIAPRFTDEFDPYSAGSAVNQYRVKKRGVHNLENINASLAGLKHYPLYTHDISQFYVVIRTSTYLSARYGASVYERNPLTAELWGKISNMYIKVDYELIKEAPTPPTVVTPTPPTPTVSKPVRKSHEVEKTFEITEYISDWGDLLNKDAKIAFESDGALPGTNLYIKDMEIKAESGKYTFEYTDEITADVSGYYVDGTQVSVVYGDGSSLISRPDQVFKFLLTWNSIFSVADLDLVYYTEAANFFAAQYYRVDFAIVEDITVREILEKLSFQLRTDQYWEAGKHRIKVLEVSSATSKQITSSDIEDISVERSDADALINLLEVRYSIDYSFLTEYSPNKFRDIITIENTASQAEYGERKSLDETFYFDYIRDDITASHVSNYYLSFYSVIRRYITMKCFLNQLELDKHDIVGVTFPLDNLANTPGRILSNRFQMGGNTDLDQIELYVLMEDYTYFKLELTDGVTFTDAIQLSLVPLVSLSEGVEFSDEIYFGFDANLGDSIVFTDSFSYNIHKTLNIRDGFIGGFGSQGWGNSPWGGDDRSFIMSDELTVEKIYALGTGFITAEDTFSIIDDLVMTLIHSPYIVDNDAFNLLVYVSDSLTIGLV